MKQTEVGLIPEDWEVKYFKELIVECIGGGTPSRGVKDYWNGDIPWMTVKDFASFNKNSTQEYITYEGLKNSATRIVKAGELIIATRIALGKIVCYDVDVTINQDLKTIKLNAEVDKSFFQFYYKSIENKIIEKGSGSTVLGLSIHDLKSFQIPLPPLAEQEAIANALSDADAWIEKLEQLIAKKRHIKQGAMQTLLTPKEDWEVKKLGEVLKLKGGYAFKSTNFIDYGIPVIRISDINGTSVELESSVYVDEHNIPKDFHAEFGDILIAMSGATTGKIGRYSYSYNSYINQRVGKFDIYDLSRHSKDYLYHLLFSKPFKNQLNKFLAQGAQPNVSGSQIEEIQLCFPKSLSEQERIATVLSDMDAEIEALEQQLGKARHIKQGMMQELLTGRTRLV